MKGSFFKYFFVFVMVYVSQFMMAPQVKAIELDKGLSIEGTGFVDFTAVSGDSYKSGTYGSKIITPTQADGKVGTDNGFHFTRAYITAKQKINDDLMVRFTYDEKDGYTGRAFVKYVYGDYSYMPGQKVRFGLGHTPWIDFEEGLYPYRFLGQVFSDFQGAQSSSDTGVSLIGSFMDKMLDYHIGVYEGEGYSSTTPDGQGFAYAGRVSFNMEGLTVAVFDWMETKRNGTADYNPSRLIGMVTYGTPMFRVAGQYLAADDNKTTANANPKFNKGNGYSVWAYTRIPGMDVLRVMARYDSMKPDTDVDLNSNTLARIAVSYDLSKSVVIALDETIKTTKVDNTGGSTTDNLLGIKAQVAF
ncbi:MAG: hypothetical protein HY036_02095 [Nitrospirae bacterium]|nr:hypothetical protein [Nitrospirota bacterium]MBI3351349.1 hypothetical protein [Nitrospirota bacterium]